MEEAERTEESAEDITAADTAPRPKNATALKILIFLLDNSLQL